MSTIETASLLRPRAMKPSTPTDEMGQWGGYFEDAAKWASHTGTFVGIGLSAFSISQGASPSCVTIGFGAGSGTGVVIVAAALPQSPLLAADVGANRFLIPL
jgi:hypothetical protein